MHRSNSSFVFSNAVVLLQISPLGAISEVSSLGCHRIALCSLLLWLLFKSLKLSSLVIGCDHFRTPVFQFKIKEALLGGVPMSPV